ncbi:MAG TPA: hypothetical protein VEL75_15805, partial [Candidatus Methylomirabilis sp.]|nr:hypothetical protein [Candidatus Methylomirabilis sp.]
MVTRREWTGAGLAGACAVTALLAAAPLRAQAVGQIKYDTYTLPNGLTVVLSEDHSTPIVHVAVWYHVGSKNEKPGRT